MKRPQIQTRLSYIFVAVTVLAIGLAGFVSNVGMVKVRCKIVYYGTVGKVGVRSGPVQIDVEQDTHCAFIRTDNFALQSDFPLQVGLTAEEYAVLVKQIPIESQFEIRYRPDRKFGLPAQDAHSRVIEHLRRYVSTIKMRPADPGE